MKQTIPKQGDKCFALYVNLTTNYVSFKIERGKFLGSAKDLNKNCEDYFVVEHSDSTVNYLKADDIHKTEKAAMRALVSMLQKKLSNTKT